MKTPVLSAHSVVFALASSVLASAAFADTPVILSTSLVRVGADNHFGVVRSHDLPVTYGGGGGDSVVDTETGTAAAAATSATYQFSLSGTTALFAIQTSQSFSAGSHMNLTEGFIQFTLSEPYVYELSGNLSGASTDPRDVYRQRTFLRFFEAPFSTIFLEDETSGGAPAALVVDGQHNGVGGSSNNFGLRSRILLPGTYELMYSLEARDNDVDGSGTSTSQGGVTLILRRQSASPFDPPTGFAAQPNGLSVGFRWDPVAGASSYQFEAGSGPGLANLYVADVGNVTSLQAMGPVGTYYARVRTRAGATLSPPSNEVSFTLGASGPCVTPGPPGSLAFSKSGPILTLTWLPGSGATGFRLQAGTAPGLANAFDGNVGGSSQQFNLTGIPAGVYYVRVLSTNTCGNSGPSNEIAIPVP
jgi:hypothetical protein